MNTTMDGVPSQWFGTASAALSSQQDSRGREPAATPPAREFEAMLLTTWLQSAETSFGTVPQPEDDQDGSDQQVKDFAAQQLARAWSDAGGIGLAHQVTAALKLASDAPKSQNTVVSR